MSTDSIINLYTDLADRPEKDFGWEKGLQNALDHGYKVEWINAIPERVWECCAAVGNPFSEGDIRKGDSLLDIGCGAGTDLCVASLLVGKEGTVVGLDITPAMVMKARANATFAGLSNISVYKGDIESLAFGNDMFDVVISNGAINLCPSKPAVFAEICRVLKDRGRLFFSDMIKDENCFDESSSEKASWADCVAGTLSCDELIGLMEEAGFADVRFLGTNHYKTSSTTVGATFSAKKGC